MTISYLEAIKQGYPSVEAVANGSPMIYENVEWIGGDAIPSQDDLDEWIATNPGWNPTKRVTKYQFRQLFTLNERVASDHAQSSLSIPANYKAILFTMNKDLELSEVVHLDNPQVMQGVGLLEQLGLIGPGRAAQIVSNTPPA